MLQLKSKQHTSTCHSSNDQRVFELSVGEFPHQDLAFLTILASKTLVYHVFISLTITASTDRMTVKSSVKVTFEEDYSNYRNLEPSTKIKLQLTS